ncbi:bactofilin family protein [Roseovarius amoyensis]|uniref:bactofilin family protein n=1 Tax=Roseovarius amoyensis TaxID=2211448 RepID=UPI000DBE393D|nr:polymer-forming cytoskeletal protein [Roseovarius amoyensis]
MSQSPDAPGGQPSAGSRGGRSHFAVGAKLTGELSAPGALELLGHVEGKVSADAIIIEDSGSAIGELQARSIAVKGRFEGKIFGGDVKLHSGARVSGEISYTTLTIESGAEVNSSCSRKVQSET